MFQIRNINRVFTVQRFTSAASLSYSVKEPKEAVDKIENQNVNNFSKYIKVIKFEHLN